MIRIRFCRVFCHVFSLLHSLQFSSFLRLHEPIHLAGRILQVRAVEDVVPRFHAGGLVSRNLPRRARGGIFADAPPLPIVLGWAYLVAISTSSTRRFLALPSSVLLEARGAQGPAPKATRRAAAMPCLETRSARLQPALCRAPDYATAAESGRYRKRPGAVASRCDAPCAAAFWAPASKISASRI